MLLGADEACGTRRARTSERALSSALCALRVLCRSERNSWLGGNGIDTSIFGFTKGVGDEGVRDDGADAGELELTPTPYALLCFPGLAENLPNECLRLVAAMAPLSHEPRILSMNLALLAAIVRRPPLEVTQEQTSKALAIGAALMQQAAADAEMFAITTSAASATSSTSAASTASTTLAIHGTPTPPIGLEALSTLLGGWELLLPRLNTLDGASLPEALTFVHAAAQWFALADAASALFRTPCFAEAEGCAVAVREIHVEQQPRRSALRRALIQLLRPSVRAHRAHLAQLTLELTPVLVQLGCGDLLFEALSQAAAALAAAATADGGAHATRWCSDERHPALWALASGAGCLLRWAPRWQPRLLIALLRASPAMRPHERLLLPVLDAPCARVGGLRRLLRRHLRWLVEGWLELGSDLKPQNALGDFPAHWLIPQEGQAAAQVRKPLGEHMVEQARDFEVSALDMPQLSPLLSLVSWHEAETVPTLLVKALPLIGHPPLAAVVGELRQVAKAQGYTLATLTHRWLPQIAARWLPLRWSHSVAAQQRWDGFNTALDMQLVQLPPEKDGGEMRVGDKRSLLDRQLSTCAAATLTQMLALSAPPEWGDEEVRDREGVEEEMPTTREWVVEWRGGGGGGDGDDNGDDGNGDGGSVPPLAGAPVRHSPAALRQAAAHLASVSQPGDGVADLICSTRSLSLEIVLLLRLTAGRGAALRTLELLLHDGVDGDGGGGDAPLPSRAAAPPRGGSDGGAMLPPMLKRPCMGVLRNLNLAPLVRLFQHAALALLKGPETLALLRGGRGRVRGASLQLLADDAPAVRQAHSYVSRCCAVLSSALDAVLAADEHGVYGSGRALKALRISHCTAVIEPLLPFAALGGRGGAAALALVRCAFEALPPEGHTQLPPISASGELSELAERCEAARTAQPLADTLATFVRLSECEPSEDLLIARLEKLLARLRTAKAQRQLVGALLPTIPAGFMGAAAEEPPDPSAAVHPAHAVHAALLRPAAEAAGRRLLQLCRQVGSSRGQMALGETLALLSSLGLVALSAEHGATSASGAASGELVEVLYRALLLLRGYLTDSCALTAWMAADVLRCALADKGSCEMIEALETLLVHEPLVFCELRSFQGRRLMPPELPAHFSQCGPRAHAEALYHGESPRTAAARGATDQTVTSIGLWSARGKTVDGWVCALAVALLPHARQPLLTQCAPLAARKPELARLCLAPALVDLLDTDAAASGRRTSQLAAALGALFREAASGEPVAASAVELLLPLLLELRSHSLPKPGERARRHEQVSLSPHFPHMSHPFSPCHFSHIILSHMSLDYFFRREQLWQQPLLVGAAAAALAVGAPLSALSLLEAAAEDEAELFPEMLLGAEPQEPHAAALFVEALRLLPAREYALGVHVADHPLVVGEIVPMHAAAKKAVADNAVAADAAVGVIDTLNHERSEAEAAGAAGSPATVRLQLAQRLREMGCVQLHAACVQVAPPPPSAVEAREAAARFVLREARHEASWRLGRWESQSDGGGGGGGSDSGGGGSGVNSGGNSEASASGGWCATGALLSASLDEGFHSSLHSILARLHEGRHLDSLSLARGTMCAVVSQLGRVGDEGGLRLLELTTRLRLCVDAAAAAAAASGRAAPALALARSWELLSAQAERLDGYALCIEPVIALHKTLLLHMGGGSRLSDEAPLRAEFLLCAAHIARRSALLPAAAANLAELSTLQRQVMLCSLKRGRPDGGFSLPCSQDFEEMLLRAEWEQMQLLWDEGTAGAGAASRSAALALGEGLVTRLEGIASSITATGSPNGAAARALLTVRACRTLAAWHASGHALGPKPLARARGGSIGGVAALYLRALDYASSLANDPRTPAHSVTEARAELCATHHAYGRWLEGRLHEVEREAEREAEVPCAEQAPSDASEHTRRLEEGDTSPPPRPFDPSISLYLHGETLVRLSSQGDTLARLALLQHAESARDGDEYNSTLAHRQFSQTLSPYITPDFAHLSPVSFPQRALLDPRLVAQPPSVARWGRREGSLFTAASQPASDHRAAHMPFGVTGAAAVAGARACARARRPRARSCRATAPACTAKWRLLLTFRGGGGGGTRAARGGARHHRSSAQGDTGVGRRDGCAP